MAEEYISLQPYYDNTDFKMGQLVTCGELNAENSALRFFRKDLIKDRRVGFVGLVENVISMDWFVVEYGDCDETGRVWFEKAIFHRSELRMGYQPSWHPMVAVDSIQDWLKRR